MIVPVVDSNRPEDHQIFVLIFPEMFAPSYLELSQDFHMNVHFPGQLFSNYFSKSLGALVQ
jgi:hypothetical protein